MLGSGRALCSFALVLAVLWRGGFAQCPPAQSTVCVTTIDVIAGNVLLRRGEVTCLQCGSTPVAGTTWTFDNNPLDSMYGEVLANGQQVIYDPECGLEQIDNFIIRCTPPGGTTAIRVGEIIVVVPPDVPPTVIVNEGEDLNIECDDSGSSELFISAVHWIDPSGNEIAAASTLLISAINRTSAGVYTCELILVEGDPLSASTTVTVQYIPDVFTSIESPYLSPVNQTLSLSCTYDAIPTPTITWLQNGSPLDPSDPRVDISSSDTLSDLMLSELMSDEGGEYVCRATNVVDSTDVSITVVVQVPPDMPTGLTITDFTTNSITLTWEIGGDGNSPITGVDIEYESLSSGVTHEGSKSLDGQSMNYTIADLQPFAIYNIQVFVVNDIGRSVPGSINEQTLSLPLGVPTEVELTPLSSEELELSWMPPDADPLTTDLASRWIVKFQIADESMEVIARNISDPNILTETFSDLEKGTPYKASVAGVNNVGVGTFSEFVTMETLVDPPSPVQSAVATALTSFAFSVSWEKPADNGGRPVTGYLVQVHEVPTGNDTEFFAMNRTIPADELSVTISGMNIQENTTYNIAVSAFNVEARGDDVELLVTTLPIGDPQMILDPPDVSGEITNQSATITWEQDPRAVVDNYIVEFKLATVDWSDSSVRSVTVPGNQTYVTLTDLMMGSTYEVRISSMNSNGISAPSPVMRFTTQMTVTLPPPMVTINGPPDSVSPGDTVVLNCTVSARPNAPVTWTVDGESLQNSDTINIDNGVVTINGVQLSDDGEYVCTFNGISATFDLNVEEGGISTTIIIIVAVIGGVGVLIFLVVLIIAIICCCRWSRQRNQGGYAPKSKIKKTNKKLNWIETSNQFVPSTNPNREQESGPTFDIPESYREASSFNTLEKQNRIERTPSPPQESGNVYATEPVDTGIPNPHAHSTSYEVGSPSFQFVPTSPDDNVAGEIPPHYSNTVV